MNWYKKAQYKDPPEWNYPEAEHDYDPSWDYEISYNPESAIVNYINQFVEEIKINFYQK